MDEQSTEITSDVYCRISTGSEGHEVRIRHTHCRSALSLTLEVEGKQVLTLAFLTGLSSWNLDDV